MLLLSFSLFYSFKKQLTQKTKNKNNKFNISLERKNIFFQLQYQTLFLLQFRLKKNNQIQTIQLQFILLISLQHIQRSMDKGVFTNQVVSNDIKICYDQEYQGVLFKSQVLSMNEIFLPHLKQEQMNINDKEQTDSSKKAEQKKLKKITYYSWSEDEESMLLQLYEKYGPAWTKFVSVFPHKNETCIKNKFHRSFDKAVRVLHEHEKKAFRKLCRVTNNRTIGIILQISAQLKELILKQNFIPNPQSLLFAYRNMFLRLCFMGSKFTYEQLTDLSNLGKAFNSKIKNLGVFRAKNIKTWRLTQSTIWTFCQIDRICLDQEGFLQKIFGNKAKKIVQTPLNVKILTNQNFLEKTSQQNQRIEIQQANQRYIQYYQPEYNSEVKAEIQYYNNPYLYQYMPLMPMDYPYIYQYLVENYQNIGRQMIQVKKQQEYEVKKQERKKQQTSGIKIQQQISE